MSFTTTIKEEISRIDNTRSESISELSGFLRNNGSCTDTTIDLLTENATVAKRIYKLIKDIYDVTCEIEKNAFGPGILPGLVGIGLRSG